MIFFTFDVAFKRAGLNRRLSDLVHVGVKRLHNVKETWRVANF